ncbi:hypothetical protein DV096_11945 [Bradymonadaceae bacterium TMQ3]|nr:hypothetical protein DV096_11945 [Bradymonadaceae bacterium TMQ3]
MRLVRARGSGGAPLSGGGRACVARDVAKRRVACGDMAGSPVVSRLVGARGEHDKHVESPGGDGAEERAVRLFKASFAALRRPTFGDGFVPSERELHGRPVFEGEETSRGESPVPNGERALGSGGTTA